MPIDPTEWQSYATPPPVVPFPELLPLDDPNLPWDRFEAFCEEFISRLPGVKETHRYGRTGSRQRGIDIFADLDTGERWAFQCRQWKKFTKTDATRAIQETTYKSDRFILMLSRIASSGVRDACDGHPIWDVWDVGDISRTVRELGMQAGARLVEAHFGATWRKDFLGLHGLASFLTPDEFFQPFSNTSALFNHGWQLVGRSDHLRQIHEFVESPDQQVAILVGRGGIGKSKILHALAQNFDVEHPGMTLWFTAEGVPLTQSGADHLPFISCVIVVDDAHRRGDLPILLALSRQRPHLVKLVLSCRPQGVSHLRSQLTQGGFDVHEVGDLPQVQELSREEVTQLGREALGSEFAGLAKRLAEATWDCPLVTVAGGQLLAKKDIAPELLERDEEFRHTVLTRFRDIIVGEVGDRIDVMLCRNLLDLIAAIQPIRLDNEQTLDCQAEYLGIDRRALVSSLGGLEESGVLLRRGNTLRIVPDVLADHILHQVSVTLQGQPTGYADHVFTRFAALCPSEVLRNLAELDWRLRWSGAGAPELLNGIWQGIEREFEGAPNSGRCTILRILEEVAVYQPDRTLQLVEYAHQNPATAPEDPEWSKVYEFTHNDVLRRLPTLLRRISYTLDFLPRCCKLLWDMGRDDTRNLNPNPDHAMRVLADLGSYHVDKPLVVNHGVLDAMEQLLESHGSHDHVHSPLDIIDPMFAKTGYSTYSQGHSLVHRSFVLKEGSIKSIRERCTSLVIRCLFSNDLKVSLRALESLENALREPIGAFDHEISDEDREQWRSEQLKILGHIENLVEHSTEPVTYLRVKATLWWHRNYSLSREIRDKADAIGASIPEPESFEFRLTQELMNAFHMDDWKPEADSGDDAYRLHQAQVEQAQRALVADLLSQSGDPTTAYSILTDRIQTMTDAGVQHQPQVLLGVLGHSDPEFAAGLCDIIVENPNGTLALYLQPLLSNVRIWNADRARAIGECVLKGDSNILRYGLASSYQGRGWADSANPEDIEQIERLLTHEDLYVRKEAIASLRTLATVSPKVAIDLAKDVELKDSELLASDLCQLFYGGWGIPFEELTAQDLELILCKLEDVQDIDDHWINAFLVRASELDGVKVVKFLLTRIRKTNNGGSRYNALPVLGFRGPLVGLATTPSHENILREIRDPSLEQGRSVGYWIPQLYREISSGFESAASLEVLDEWIGSGSGVRIKAAARLVSSADPSFVFKEVRFVSNLLERAQVAGYDCYQSVSSYLARSALSGIRSGTPGQPMPEDVALREQAAVVANTFDSGSPTFRFYDSVAKSAEANIRYQLLRDEELGE